MTKLSMSRRFCRIDGFNIRLSDSLKRCPFCVSQNRIKSLSNVDFPLPLLPFDSYNGVFRYPNRNIIQHRLPSPYENVT